MTDIHIAVIVDEDSGYDFVLASTSYDDLQEQVTRYVKERVGKSEDEDYRQLVAEGKDPIDAFFRDDETSFERRVDFYVSELKSHTDVLLVRFLNALTHNKRWILANELRDLFLGLGWSHNEMDAFINSSDKHVGVDDDLHLLFNK
jgi:hypothetical protein